MHRSQRNPFQAPDTIGVQPAGSGKSFIGFWALLSVFACVATAIVTCYARGQVVQLYEEFGLELPGATRLMLNRTVQFVVTVSCVVLIAIVVREKDAKRQQRKAFVVLFVAGAIGLFYLFIHLLPTYFAYSGLIQ